MNRFGQLGELYHLGLCAFLSYSLCSPARWLAFDSGSFVFAEIMDLTEAEPTNCPNVNKMHHVCV